VWCIWMGWMKTWLMGGDGCVWAGLVRFISSGRLFLPHDLYESNEGTNEWILGCWMFISVLVCLRYPPSFSVFFYIFYFVGYNTKKEQTGCPFWMGQFGYCNAVPGRYPYSIDTCWCVVGVSFPGMHGKGEMDKDADDHPLLLDCTGLDWKIPTDVPSGSCLLNPSSIHHLEAFVDPVLPGGWLGHSQW